MRNIHNIDYQLRTFSRGIVIGEKSSWGAGKARQIGELLLARTKELGFLTATAKSKVANIASTKNLTHQMGSPVIEGDMAIFELNFSNWPDISKYDNPAEAPSYIWDLFNQ